MNKKMLQAIIIRLNEIKKGYQVDNDQGICLNLLHRSNAYNTYSFIMHRFSNNGAHPYRSYKTIDSIHVWLREQFEAWPECHTYGDGIKNFIHPVEGWEKYAEEREQGTLWQNPKRFELLDFLISQANIQLNTRLDLLNTLIKRAIN